MNTDVYDLVPGILGSVLQTDGKDVFGLTAEAGLRALISGGQSIIDLQLSEPVWEPAEAGGEEIRSMPDLGDGVTADRLARDAHLISGPWKIDGYGEVSKFLRRELSLVTGETYFEFPYDWRRDTASPPTSSQPAAASGSLRAETNIQTHSWCSSGIRCAAWCRGTTWRVLGGWRDTRWLITFGTPYRGSLMPWTSWPTASPGSSACST
jgi:hypothetical protein